LITPKDRYPFIDMMRKDRTLLSKALAATVPTLRDPVFFETLVDDAVVMAEKAWVGNADALSRFDVSGMTDSFTKPVLVLWGKGDFIVTEQMAGETARAYPSGELKILENVGHSLIVENPVLFVELLLEFLGKTEKKK
jgi:pimeloyl-ACP methyl ester carboxylesterase